MAADLTTIAFDADDTLWQNEQFYRITQERFAALLADFAAPDHLESRLLEAERKNLGHYGFGIKGFTLSMIETAIEVTEGRVPAAVIGGILEAGREMLSHPIELLPHARAAVETLADKTAATYGRVFRDHGDGPARAMMVGNSLKSDVRPALEAGSWGVYIPHDLTWVVEHSDRPEQDPRFRELEHLGQLEDLVRALA